MINGSMVEGGGFTPGVRAEEDPRAGAENEANNGLKNDIGTIAMARMFDPHLATVYFSINDKNNDFSIISVDPARLGLHRVGQSHQGHGTMCRCRFAAVDTGQR